MALDYVAGALCVAALAAVLLRGSRATADDGGLAHLADLVGVSLGGPAEPPASTGVTVLAAEQEWSVPTKNESCHTHTPLTIGEKEFARGVGTHANGRFVLRLEEPFTALRAEVGVDHNYDTAGGTGGTVVFQVLVDGQERARTDVCRCGDPPRALDVDVSGARQVEILVEDAGDGISYDQADLAEIQLVREDGSVFHLEDALTSALARTPFLPEEGFPSRFTYGDKEAGELLAGAPDADVAEEQSGVLAFERRWTLPDGVLCVLEGRVFRAFGAVEYRLVFENPTDQPSALLADVDSLALEALGRGTRPELIACRGGLAGTSGSDLGFTVRRIALSGRADPVTLTVEGGRSSNGDLPLFQVHAPGRDAGIFAGIGWSGQWRAETGLDAKTGRFGLRAGMPGICLRIPPGERIITPRILLGAYQDGERVGGNTLRRILYEHYAPLLAGAKPLPPISFNHWFTMANDIDEPRMMATAAAAARLGLEYFVIDAGWFDGGFPKGVGNWTIDTAKFPNGLKPISDFVRARGMKFGLWFEPERVDPGTRLAEKHPEWVHGRLLWLGERAAQDWVIDLIDRYAREYHIEWIRYDFNTNPLPVWTEMDAPDTRGLAQIRHMMGLYRVLDEIMKRQPTLLIEGCSSGGRRIDLETIARSHTFWKSDHTRDVALLRYQATGGNLFLPGNYLNLNFLYPGEPYEYHSLFGGPLGFGIKFAEVSDRDLEDVKRHIVEYRAIRRYLVEDYYPLFEQDLGEQTWAGWQFHDPADGSGVVIVIRKAASVYHGATLALQGVDTGQRYVVTDVASEETWEATGEELAAGLEVTIKEAPGSRVWRYEPVP